MRNTLSLCLVIAMLFLSGCGGTVRYCHDEPRPDWGKDLLECNSYGRQMSTYGMYHFPGEDNKASAECLVLKGWYDCTDKQETPRVITKRKKEIDPVEKAWAEKYGL